MFKCVLFEISIEVKNIELQGHETCNYKEYRAATAEDFTLTLCVANICNQEQAIPSSHNNKLGVTKTAR